MKKNLLFSAILATVLFAGNAFSINFKPYVTVVNKIDKDLFGADQDIWIHFDTLSSSCVHKCSYHRIKPGDDYTPTGSFFGNKLTVVTYVPGEDGKIRRLKSSEGIFTKTFEAKTNKVEVRLIKRTKKGIIGKDTVEYEWDFKDAGSTWNVSLSEVKDKPLD